MSIYGQAESDWILNTCFRPSDPVLVCLLNNVISAQREDIDAAASSHFSSVLSHLLLLPTWLSHYLVVHTHTLTHIFTHIPRTHSQEPPLPVWAQILIPPLHPQIHHLVLCLQDSRLLRSDGMFLDEGSNERPLLISLWPFSKERSEELLAVHFPGSVPYLVLICQGLGPWDTTHLLNRSGWRLKMVPAPLLDAWKWSSGLIPQQCSVLFLPQPEMNRVALTLPSYFFPETQKLFERRSRVFLSLGEAPCYVHMVDIHRVVPIRGILAPLWTWAIREPIFSGVYLTAYKAPQPFTNRSPERW